ncbi:MAG: NAD(P)/FAD-dependent oxidoreductase [Pseudomonadota bacterium]|nr:NAD(P)/FAD-dependent oxidoreductase [Pseudomonadota bacterium]
MAVWDAVVIGGGAAGLFCAALAGQRGRRILVIDHGERIAEKIRISGGGRCNFTNRELDASAPQRHFLSRNPQFCRSALARYTPQDFIALLDRHGIGWHEKHRGQLFCDQGSGAIIDMLLDECARGAVERHQPCAVHAVRRTAAVPGLAGECFELDSDAGTLHAHRLVVATGGLSIPPIGATDFGHRLARQFGLKVVEPRPALVPLTFAAEPWAPFAALAGVALPARVRCGSGKTAGDFREDLLFTHRGLSGPAILQISSYWTPGAELAIDLCPGHDLAAELLASKPGNRKRVAALLGQWLPERLAQLWVDSDPLWQRPLADLPDKPLRALAQSIQDWRLTPNGSEGFRKAEVTLGGVDTRALSSQTLEARDVPGLHFIGEVVDVTGWLGGYNFQWAWASAHACALAL